MSQQISLTPPELSPDDQIQFVDRHRPRLPDGGYQITLYQQVTIGDHTLTDQRHIGPYVVEDQTKAAPIAAHFPEPDKPVTVNFHVLGPRFQLDPALVHAVFPPDNSQGRYSHTLPHLILERSTLPWERFAQGKVKDPETGLPWLALLLFEADQAPPLKTVPLPTLLAETGPGFPALQPEISNETAEAVTVIDVAWKDVRPLLPTAVELPFLTHVRLVGHPERPPDPDGNGERAVIVGSRLPTPGKACVMHLVALEGRYLPQGDGFAFHAIVDAAADDTMMRFVSLKTWSFTCLPDGDNFKQRLEKLNRSPSTLHMPVTTAVAGSPAERFVRSGYHALPHFWRRGAETRSWYHGPLLPAAIDPPQLPLPARSSDELLIFDTALGMFDVSYAAAWELGRMMALQDSAFALRLFHWKREHARQSQYIRQKADLLYLPLAADETWAAPELPAEISDWLYNLTQLQGIPFNYLIPDERLLPTESLRFFVVDPLWLACLRDGAFSIGRVLEQDASADSAHHEKLPIMDRLSGFLLRSQVVSGWPNLIYDGYAATIEGQETLDAIDPQTHPKLETVRQAQLSSHVVLGLFRGQNPEQELRTLDIHMRPEILHFGLNEPDIDDTSSFTKELRDAGGVEISQEIEQVPFIVGEIQGRLDIMELVGQMEALRGAPFTSADFALQMVVGVELGRFIRAR